MKSIFEKSKYLGRGADSEVFLFENIVLKDYGIFRAKLANLSDEEAIEILNTYYKDTDKAIGLVKDNTLSLKFESKNYTLFTRVLAQGNIESIEDKLVGVGQEFVEGPTLNKILRKRSVHELEKKEKEYNKTIIANKTKIIYNLLGQINKVNKELGTNFYPNPVNIKPVFNYNERSIELLITDLVTAIISNYNIEEKYNCKAIIEVASIL